MLLKVARAADRVRLDWTKTEKTRIMLHPTGPALWHNKAVGWVECERPYTEDDLKLSEDTEVVRLKPTFNSGQCRTAFYSEDLKDKLRNAKGSEG